MPRPIRFGVQTTPQNTTWRELADTWKTIDELDFDTAWTFDHFFPILSDPSGPCFEGWIALAALAASTKRVRAGVLVSGNTYRHPAVLAKMGATLDHACEGRLTMGIGAAWFEMEHAAYGIPFHTPPERIARLDEAAHIIKQLWTNKLTTFEGKYYQIKDAYCEPKPVQQPHPPIMIGAAGEKLALRVVAKHADQWNTFGSPELFRHKISVLRGHCESVGRDFDEIEVSWAGTTLVTESKTRRESLVRRLAEAFGRPPEEIEPGMLIGSAGEIRDRISRFIEAGVTHFILIAAAPLNLESLRTFSEKVLPTFRS